MSDNPDDPQYRAHYQPDPAEITVRELDDDEDGLFVVRMPIASTGEVRNEGDEPLTRDELDGMAAQINERDAPVFLAHGRSWEITDARYGQTERLGTWRDGEVVSPDADERDHEDIEDLLYSSAVMADPETLPEETGRFREALAILKEQAKRSIPLSASIGWREDPNSPGGNDLMEASIVGIPADPRTFTQEATAEAMARAAIDAGADPEAFVESVRSVVMGANDPDGRDSETSMTDDNTEPDEESGADDEQTERDEEPPEWVQTVLENQEAQTEILQSLADAMRQDDDDEDDEDEDDEEENADDDEDDDEDEEQAAEVEQMQDALDTLREGGVDVSDVDLPDEAIEPDDEQDADTSDSEESTGDSYNKFGLRSGGR